MAIHYFCRHCGTNIGSIDHQSLHSKHIGIDMLTNEERQEMVSYESDGNIHIHSICEDCQEAFERSPNLHEYDYLIH